MIVSLFTRLERLVDEVTEISGMDSFSLSLFEKMVTNAVKTRMATENTAPYFRIFFPCLLVSFVLNCEDSFCCSIKSPSNCGGLGRTNELYIFF